MAVTRDSLLGGGLMVATFALNHRRVRAPNLNERADEDQDKARSGRQAQWSPARRSPAPALDG